MNTVINYVSTVEAPPTATSVRGSKLRRSHNAQKAVGYNCHSVRPSIFSCDWKPPRNFLHFRYMMEGECARFKKTRKGNFLETAFLDPCVAVRVKQDACLVEPFERCDKPKEGQDVGRCSQCKPAVFHTPWKT